MSFDVNNFVIDKPLRGSMISPSTGDILWSVNQVESPALNCTGETVDAVDALGTPIMQFDRAKRAEFSASNSLFDLGLAAAQFGTEKKIADIANPILTPKFEEFTVKSTDTTIVLKETPVGVAGAEIKQIYSLRGDSTLGVKYELGVTASSTEFEFDSATKTITLPTGLEDGTRILVRYDYNSTSAVEVANSAVNFPKAGKFILEVLGSDVCTPDIKYFAYIVFPNAKLTTNVDLTFTTEGKHPFSITCLQQYCDGEKRLFNIIVPEAA